MKTIKHFFGIAVSLVALMALTIVFDGLTDNIQKADVIVILGNKVELNGMPSLRLQSRLDKGIELYEQSISEKILVSGGTGKEGFDEAVVMKNYLVEQGIAAEKIVIDSKGIDSYNTAKNTKAFMQNNNLMSALIVSNYYHISRTRVAFKKVGIETVYSAHSNYFEFRDLYSIAREVIGYFYYLFRAY